MAIVVPSFLDPAQGLYGTQQQLSEICFPANLATWSQGNASAINPSGTTAPDIARIQYAFNRADGKINDVFRNSRYQVPFVFNSGITVAGKPVASEINRLELLECRWDLYESARGYLETDPSAHRYKGELDEQWKLMNLYLCGARWFDAQLNPGQGTGPRVYVNL